MSNYISKVTLPSGGTYEIKDQGARDLISGLTSITFVIAWNGSSTPVVANIPKGVVVTYSGNTYTGTLEASSANEGSFYLVSGISGIKDTFEEYVVVTSGSTKSWERIGTTDVDLAGLVTGVTLNKQTDVVLGEATTFSGSVDVPTASKTKTVISATASGTAVGKTTRYLSASASGTAVGANGTADAVTGYTPSTNSFVTGVSTSKLATTTVPNVTSAGSASTWSFAMGTGTGNEETLIISGGNGTAPTLGTAKTVATGSLSASGGGGTVATGASGSSDALTALGTPTTETVLTGVQVTAQPTITLTANTSTATGRITYVEALGTVTQPTISLSQVDGTSASSGKVLAVGDVTFGTTAEPVSITVGTNDKVTALTNSTSITVTEVE